jgi:hypothetical protein
MNNKIDQINNGALSNLELKLADFLKPVRPNPEFINTLKMKLTRTPSIILETSKKKFGIIALAVGLFVGAIVVWLVKRTKSKD